MSKPAPGLRRLETALIRSYPALARTGGQPVETFEKVPPAEQEKLRRLERKHAEAVERDAAAQAALPLVREQDRVDLQAAVHAGVEQLPEPRLPEAEAEARAAREMRDATRAALVEQAQVNLAVLADEDLEQAAAEAEEQRDRALREAIESGTEMISAIREASRARHAAGWVRQLLERGAAPPFLGEHVGLPSHLKSAVQAVRPAIEDVERELAGDRWRGLTEAPAPPGELVQPGSRSRGPRDRGEPQPRRGFRTSGIDPLGGRGGGS